ncbi:PRPL21 [Auxenochlorella protothecoides x Auxenochlorella symbiontica]
MAAAMSTSACTASTKWCSTRLRVSQPFKAGCIAPPRTHHTAPRSTGSQLTCRAAAAEAVQEATSDRDDSQVPSYAQNVPASYTVVDIGGHQMIVEKGRWYEVNRLEAAPGSTIRLGRVLAHKANGDIRFGTPYLEDVAVHAKVLDHMQGEKITVFKYKPKKHYRRTNGHRQQLTRFMVTEVLEGQEAGEAPVAVVDENPAAATEEAA